MSHPSVDPSAENPATILLARPACLVAGCPCKDVRIVSRRQAAFFASLSRSRGETADRVIDPEPEWRVPTSATLDDPPGAAP